MLKIHYVLHCKVALDPSGGVSTGVDNFATCVFAVKIGSDFILDYPFGHLLVQPCPENLGTATQNVKQIKNHMKPFENNGMPPYSRHY
jgi:hypothetical protein